MLDFTRRSAQRFNLQWKDLPERSGDHWKIEVEMFGRVPMLLIVHEQTLFTLVRRKSQFKTPEQLADEIRLCCSRYKNKGETTFGRNTERRLTGSITEMKRITRVMDSHLRALTQRRWPSISVRSLILEIRKQRGSITPLMLLSAMRMARCPGWGELKDSQKSTRAISHEAIGCDIVPFSF